MPDTVLLLGHAKEAGLALVRTLAALEYTPMAAGWEEFAPRAYGRRRPAVLLADVDQPGAAPMEELAARVRKAWGATYPILAMTGAKKFRDVSALIDAGASDCLPPSASPALLDRKLARCLRQQSSAAVSELAGDVPDGLLELFTANQAMVRLGDVAGVYAGATPRRAWCRRMAPPDDSWRGVVTSEAVERFFVGRPGGYLLWTRLHLFRVPGPEEYNVPEKVLLSRSGPPLKAAVDRSRLPAGTDVSSVVPGEGATAGYLACLLNSRLLDFYFNRLSGAADGRLRIEAIRETPVPKPAPAPVRELTRIASLLSHFGPNPQSWIDRQTKEELWERMENIVFDLYGAGREIRESLAALHF